MTVSLGAASGAAPVTVDGDRGLRQHAQRRRRRRSATTRPTSSRPGPTARPRPTTSRRRRAPPTRRGSPRARRAPRRSPSTPSADAHVEQANPDHRTSAPPRPLRTDAGADPDAESYLRFLVDGVTGKVQSAKLRLLLRPSSTTVDGPAAFPTSNAGGERTINWNNKPAPDRRGPRPTRAAIATDVWTEWDVTPAVTGDGPVSFRLAQTRAPTASTSTRASRRPTTRAAGAGADRGERHLRAAEGRDAAAGRRWCPPSTPARARTAPTARRSSTRRATRPRSRRRS